MHRRSIAGKKAPEVTSDGPRGNLAEAEHVARYREIRLEMLER